MATAKKKSVFETLSAIDVTNYVEKKGGMDYVSWAVAWGILKKTYPNATRKIYEHDHTGLNFFTDGQTAYVKVGITVEGEEHIDMLPVMDYRNKSISVDKMSSFDVNKTIRRATAKAIAMHGLGISLWWKNAEDLEGIKPSEIKETPKKKSENKAPKLPGIPKGKWEDFVMYVTANKQMGYNQLVANIEAKYTLTQAQLKEIKKITG